MYAMYIADAKEQVLFPVTPSKLTIKIKNQNKTITLINEGEVNWIKTPGLTDIKIDKLILPMYQNYPFAIYDKGFKKAEYYLNKLEQWKRSTKPVTFILSRTTPNNRILLFDTNMTVTIENYEMIEDVENNGLDMAIQLEMKQYEFWGVKKLKVKKKKKATDKAKASKPKKTRKTKQAAKSYTIKSGDTLYGIARKQLNDANKWKSIYTLNKKVIEDAAKKHGRKSSSEGHWIYPGTKINLPS
jgi:LysM repeat protein